MKKEETIMENTIIFNNMESFTEEVSRVVQEKAKAEVIIKKVLKNNGLELTGLMFKKEENITPTIYLEPYYNDYLDGISLSDIANKITRMAEAYALKSDFNVDFIMDWEQAKDYITYKLINREMNAEKLKEIPFIPFGDLAVTFQLLIENTVFGTGTITISNEQLRSWGKSVQDLYIVAEKNKDEVVIQSLFDVLTNLAEKGEFDQIPASTEEIPIYLLSNPTRYHGACAMLDSAALKAFGEEYGDFYIIPSSIHECILQKASCISEEEVNAMIQEVNTHCVSIEEQLSNHAYYYDTTTNKLYDSYSGSEMTLSLV